MDKTIIIILIYKFKILFVNKQIMNLPSSGKDQHSETNQQSLAAEAAKTDFVVVRNGIELNESDPTSLNAKMAVSLSGSMPTSPIQKTANDEDESQNSAENRVVQKNNSFELDSQGRSKKHRNHSKKAIKSQKKNKSSNKKKIMLPTNEASNKNDLSIQQTERSNDSIETPQENPAAEKSEKPQKQVRLQVTTEFVSTPPEMIPEQDQTLEESPDLQGLAQKKEDNKQNTALPFPPPLDVYRPKINVNHDCVSYGLNMYFKKPHKCSEDPDQAGGDLAPHQTFLSQPWGANGCPPQKQQALTQYVTENLCNVVFSRYGLEYLKSFPRSDDIQIGSYRINLDYLIFQKQKQNQNTESKNSLVEMNFLKIKGQNQMSKAMNSQSQKDVAQGNTNPQARMIIPFYKTLDADTQHNTLEFDSVFESGNLALAMKVSDTEYDCLLQNDINTNGHTQWFYFKVKSNFKKATSVKIKLINLYKCKSLFQYGMRVLTLDVSKSQNLDESTTTASTSKAESAPELPKWQRSCSNISYIQNKYTNDFSPSGLYQVEFTYEFGKGPKEIYFAHSLPYTYSMLNEYLSKQKVKRYTLCHSLAGNKVEYLYVTSKSQNSSSAAALQDQQQPQNSKAQGKKPKQNPAPSDSKTAPPIQKQVIMITSRVHPGETGASWMIHGLIDTLLNPSTAEEKRLVKNLKDHFEFYIVPMLNVDGVINGNYRCSLAACDLNRKWAKPSKALHPSVYYTKKLCQTLTEAENKQFFLYLDFHGHSVKKNIFQYGNKMENLAPSRQRCPNSMQPSIFPMVLSKQFDYFNFQDCTFSMPKSKDSTARITMFHKLRIPFVFTLEASFAGANRGALAGKHFSQRDLMNVGKYVLQAFWEVKKLQMNKSLLREVAAEAQSQARVSNDDEPDSEGCSSSEEEGELPTSANAKKAIEVIQEEASPLKEPAIEEAGAPESPSPTATVTRKGLKNQHTASRIIHLKQTQPPQEDDRTGRRSSHVSSQNTAVKHRSSRTHENRQAHVDRTKPEAAHVAQPLEVISNSGVQERGSSALKEKIKVMRKTQRLNIIGLQQDQGDYIEAGFDPNQTQAQPRSHHLGDGELELAVPMSVRHQIYQPRFVDNASQYQIRRVEEHIQAMNNLEKQQQLQQQQVQQPQQQWGASANRRSRRQKMQQQAANQSGHSTTNDLIQLPESITDNFIGQSNRNIHLQQFLLNHLSKKQRQTNFFGATRPNNNLPALESGAAGHGKPPLAKHPSLSKQAVLMYATTYKLDYQETDPHHEHREAYNISQTSKVSKGVKGSKLKTKEVKQAALKDKNTAAKTKAQWGHANSATITQNAFYISRDYLNIEDQQPQQHLLENSKRRYNSIQNGPSDVKHQAPFFAGESQHQDMIDENPIDFDFQTHPHTDVIVKKQKSKSGMKKKGHNHLSDIIPTDFDHKNRSLQFPPFSASANLHLQMKSTQQGHPTMDQKIQRMSAEYDNKSGQISFHNQKIMQQIERNEKELLMNQNNVVRQSRGKNPNSPFEQMYKGVYDPESKKDISSSGRQSKTKVHMSIFPGSHNAAVNKNFQFGSETVQLLNMPKNANKNSGSSDVLPDINQSFNSPSKSRLLIKPQQISFMGMKKQQQTLDNVGSPYAPTAKKHALSLLDPQIEQANEFYVNTNMESRLSHIQEVQNTTQRAKEMASTNLDNSGKPISKQSRQRNKKDAYSERNSQLRSKNPPLQQRPEHQQQGQTYKVNFSSKINMVSSTPLNKAVSQMNNQPKKKS